MENEKQTGYILYDFMKAKLGLSGVPLRVFALIYSFTKAGGDCHASLKNIGIRVDASSRSVQRALNELIDKGYIVKITSNKNNTNHYVVDLEKVGYVAYANSANTAENVHADSDSPRRDVHADSDSPRRDVHADSDLHRHDDYGGATPCQRGMDTMSNNNKNNNKENNHLLTNITYLQEKQPLRFYGRKKVVRLTFHQYGNLLRAVGVLPTLHYINVLELRIIGHPEFNYTNHYKTIITWARQDGYINSELEIRNSK